MTFHSATVHARAALAGNPSDGYGGRIVAASVPGLTATVTVESTSRFRVGDLEFSRVNEIASEASLRDSGDAALFLASLVVANQRWGIEPCAVTWQTAIPRSVGLSGSSALVIATLQALAEANAQKIEPSDLPLVALEAEELLGITAGLQDRVVQTFGGVQAMSFGDRTFTQRKLQPGTELDLAILWDPEAAEPSQNFHGALRERFDAGEASVVGAMEELAAASAAAEDAIEMRDMGRLGEAMNASFDLRASISDLSPSHVRLIELARSCGVAANYAGSGGAVTCLISSDDFAPNLVSVAKKFRMGFFRWKPAVS